MNGTARHIVIVTPVLNDWACFVMLAGRLREVLGAAGWSVGIVAVDDGSTEPPPDRLEGGGATILRLARNVGHQRAIAIGLDYALRESGATTIAVMDVDGEDRPEDLPLLLSRLGDDGARIVVAARRRRSEGTRFTAFYKSYKTAFRILTGERLDFGNFSVMDRTAARRLVAMHELWLNLPATIMRSRLSVVRVPTDRGQRYFGQSRMNLVALVVHGLSAVGVFVERVFTRVLLAVGSVAFVMFAGLLVGLLLKAADLATPGWVTTIASALVIVLIQTATVALCGLFVVFGNASNVVMGPAANARTLIESIDVLTATGADRA